MCKQKLCYRMCMARMYLLQSVLRSRCGVVDLGLVNRKMSLLCQSSMSIVLVLLCVGGWEHHLGESQGLFQQST